MNATLSFSAMQAQHVELVSLRARYTDLLRDLNAATDAEAFLNVVRQWDSLRKTIDTSRALAQIHFSQDTRNAAFRETHKHFSDVAPDLIALDQEVIRAVTASPFAPEVEKTWGPQLGVLWKCELAGFAPSIADLRRKESDTINEFNSLRGNASIEIDGRTFTLGAIRGLLQHRDRAVRLQAAQGEERFYRANGPAFDTLYDTLVQQRHKQSLALGHTSFTPLGYTLMRRSDYNAADVAVFRDAIVQHAVPLAKRLHTRRARALGHTDHGFHDEAVAHRLGNTVPRVQGDTLLARLQDALAEVHPDMGTLCADMRTRGLFDIELRQGKLSGGFCEGLPDHGTPFILANCNGSAGDVVVLIHEMGHGFQYVRTLAKWPTRDFHIPTYEAAEISSMGLELLSLPYAGHFFADDAPRFAAEHLETALLFLPYGSAIDHFQHEVYEHPSYTADQRASCWKDLEKRYLPFRKYHEMPHYESGRFWHRQHHIFQMPFYYIDYVLASVCAMQLWVMARTDRAEALKAYMTLAELGGSLPFRSLVREAGLKDPFEPDTVRFVLRELSHAVGA